MKLRAVLVGLCLLLLSLPALAQDTEVAEWGNYGLEVEFNPDDWAIDEENENAALTLFNDDMTILFYEPWSDYDDAEEVTEVIVEDENFEFEDPFEIEIMGETAFQIPYTDGDYTGFVVAFEYDGMVFTLAAFVADDNLSSSDEETLLEVVETIRESDGGSSNNNSSGGDTIETAADEGASGEDVVEELVELGLVEDGGDFLFEVDEIDEETLEFADGYEGGSIAIGGYLSLESADDDEDYRFCAFIAQSSTDDLEAEEGTMLITGFDSTGVLLTYEFDIADSDNSIFEEHDPGVDIEDTSHVLLIVQNDELDVYVNGELTVENWELDLSAGDDELFTGFIANEGCVMSNIWAYSFE